MIRLTYCLRMLPGMSRQDFQTYWRKKHGPLVASYSTVMRIRKYIQVHTLEDPMNQEMRDSWGTAEPYDGVAELWWDSRQDIIEVFENPEALEAIQILVEDEKNFIDLKRSPGWYGYEVPQINPIPENVMATEKGPLVKFYYVLRQLPHQSLEEVQSYWRMSHGPCVRRYGPAIRTLRYIQVHRLEDELNALFAEPRGIEEPLYFGHAELWFDRAAVQAASGTPEGIKAREILIADESKFIDFSRSALWLAKEHRFVDLE
jgi:uncharacterized protein (TIGR02118 family)